MEGEMYPKVVTKIRRKSIQSIQVDFQDPERHTLPAEVEPAPLSLSQPGFVDELSSTTFPTTPLNTSTNTNNQY